MYYVSLQVCVMCGCRDCYFLQLLHEYHKLLRDRIKLGSNVEYTPEWSCC